MRLAVLGPLELRDTTGAPVPVSGPKRRALLAALAVRANHAVPVSRLVVELWGHTPPANATNALQAHITRLRKAVEAASGEPRIISGASSYTLVLRTFETDVAEFRTALANARAVPPTVAVPALRAALSLWRGAALDGCVSGDICATEAALLEESRLSALESLYDACLRDGRFGEVIAEVSRASAAHPLRERFYVQWMDALCRAGRPGEALGVYEKAARRLRTELGVEPGPALRFSAHQAGPPQKR